ncbi:hypothetical protein [Marinifilum sp.]|uniref:hypothetical protein n=1 Tax=Marinifilum sp. TaxID=2033137 RepID=UPI003BAA09B8
MKLLKYTLILLFSAGIMSCGGGGSDEPEDIEKPKATISSPGNTVTTGENFNVTFSASDDIGLKSYRVQISIVNATGMSVKSYQSFSFDSNVNLTDANDESLPVIAVGDKSASVNFPISTSFGENTVATKGMYQLTVTVTDTSNKTDSFEKTFQIQD